MPDIGNIFTDDRTITGISSDGWSYSVGIDRVTKIVMYREYGQASHVPAFAVYKGDWLYARVVPVGFEVRYGQKIEAREVS
jgi:hypothetical protein